MDVEVVAAAADGLVEFDRARRQAEAGVVSMLIRLAEEYRFDDQEMIEVLADRQRLVRGSVEQIGVSQYLALEVAGLLGISAHAAASRIIDAVQLKYRHPELLAAVLNDELEAYRALAAARRFSALDPDRARWAGQRWLRRQVRLSYGGSMKLADRLLIEADPETAVEREHARRTSRGVYLWGQCEGVINLSAILGVLDGKYLMATINRLAEILLPENPGLTVAELRAKALGILSHPAMALALLNAAKDQPALVEITRSLDQHTGEELLPNVDDPAPAQPHPPAPSGPLDPRSRPKLGIAVHIDGDALEGLSPTARVEAAGHITCRLLGELLGEGLNGSGTQIAVHPVIDPATMPAQDQHDPSTVLRRAVLLLFPTEPFPFSNRSCRGLDLDHTVPYRPGPHGQTRLGNLAPAGRTVHRAKTAGLWRMQLDTSPRGSWAVTWRSPLGYRYRVTRDGTTRLPNPPPLGELPP